MFWGTQKRPAGQHPGTDRFGPQGPTKLQGPFSLAVATWLALTPPNQGLFSVSSFTLARQMRLSSHPYSQPWQQVPQEDQDRPLGQFAVLVFPDLLPSSQACFICGVKHEGLKIKGTTL